MRRFVVYWLWGRLVICLESVVWRLGERGLWFVELGSVMAVVAVRCVRSVLCLIRSVLDGDV